MLGRHHKLWSNRVRCVTAALQYNSYVAICVTNLHSSIQIWARGSNAGCNHSHHVVSNAECNYGHLVVSNAGCNYGHCVVSIICCISMHCSLSSMGIHYASYNHLSCVCVCVCVCVCMVRLGIHSSVQ